MTADASHGEVALIVNSGARLCAIPIRHVAETMRPLPIDPLPGTPSYVRGVAVVRGVPIAVVDLSALLNHGEVASYYGRFVTVSVGERRIALGVDAVVGLRNLDALSLADLPALLGDAPTDLVERIGICDAQLLVVLRAARIVPDHVWAALATSSPIQ